MASYPLWQISWTHVVCNGSQHTSQIKDDNGNPLPVLWWQDMPLEFQLACERLFHSHKYTAHLIHDDDAWGLTQAVHIIDIRTMTILNTNDGTLRRIRRQTSDLPW